MQTQINNAMVLEIVDKSFKGRDGEQVSYRQARILDEQNNYHEMTVDKECELPEGWETLNREEMHAVISVEEITNNGNTRLKKRLIQLG